MTKPGNFWASDTPISMPVPPEDNEVLLDMGALGVTIYGINHNLNRADLEDYLTPTFLPQGVTNIGE